MSNRVTQNSKTTDSPSQFKAENSTESLSGREIMQEVLSKPRKAGNTEPEAITGVVIGTLSGIGDDGQPLVHYPGIPGGEALSATSAERATDFDSGREVALAFIQGNPEKPVILGFIQKPEQRTKIVTEKKPGETELDVKLDGERLRLSAEKEIVLSCGKSSITLTRAGKIIIKGAYLSNHSTGVNRIKGGSVQIN